MDVKQELSWRKTRELVWKRDGNRCQVCRKEIPKKHYHCGHIIDRVAGGDDSPDNLVVMCDMCNIYKPVHDTLEEYDDWVRSGHWVGEALEKLVRAVLGDDYV
jgi:5-methylcytosine-specific restriction endonuclease McrA